MFCRLIALTSARGPVAVDMTDSRLAQVDGLLAVPLGNGWEKMRLLDDMDYRYKAQNNETLPIMPCDWDVLTPFVEWVHVEEKK